MMDSIFEDQRLKNVEINPGRLCNNKCIFCTSGEERDEHLAWAAPSRMKEEIQTRYKEGARSIGFLGGEPTAYPHILDCMSYAKSLGYLRIALCTNGTRLARPDFFKNALKTGLSRVTISVHSHVPKIEEYLVGVPGILEKKIKAITHLVMAKKRGLLKDGVSLNPVLCRQNAKDMEDYVRFFSSLGIDDIRFNYIWPESRVIGDKNVVPSYSQTIPYILNLIYKNEKAFGLRISFGGIPYCVLPRSVQKRWPLLRKYFYEEGNDLPTEVSFLWDDKKGGVQRFNWHKKGRDVFRAKVEACKSCHWEPFCMGVYRSYLDLYGESEFGLKAP